jgi:uncharacterized protein YcbX
MLKISQLYIYPIKSLPGISIIKSVVTDRGLEYDRRWMLVDENNKFLTLREFPKMALLKVSITDNYLIVRSIELDSTINIPLNIIENSTNKVIIWNATVKAQIVSKEANEWFSKVINTNCKLVFMPENSLRPVDTTSGYHPEGKFTSFADAYPFLLLGQASMDDLNERLESPFSILRFRPNIVFEGSEPYHEDNIENFTINGINFTGLENCARCKIPNIDPETGIFSIKNEPLKTLSKYRNRNKNIEFGRNIVHNGKGIISVGDEIILQ